MLRAKYTLQGHPSLKGATKMRVFCPEHKRGFFAPRQSPVKCENRGLLLGELDFEGQGKSPIEIRWQYCCNCEHFCPVDFDQFGLARCAVCTRRSSQLYLCDKCYVISFESNTPLDVKNFTLTPESVPEPSCPACLRPAPADLHEHHCDELGASFVTGLTTCPICEERLDLAPAFPSSVAQYLKRTKSAHKTNVTFDYETESFVPVEDGEFVVINSGEPNVQPIVMPRALRFGARREFYEFYQDYYHCQKPEAGEVHVLRPAAVTRTGAGWKLQTTGLLEIIPDHPRKKPVEVPVPVPVPAPAPVAAPVPAIEPIVQKRIDELRALDAKKETKPVREEPDREEPAVKEEPELKTCNGCGASIESRYSFCWKCGSALSSLSNGPVVVRSKPLPLPIDDDERTLQHDPQARGRGNSMFSWTMSKPPDDHPSSSKGSVLKLMGIGAVAFVLLAIGYFGLTRSDSQVVSANSTTPATQTVEQQPTASEPAPAPKQTETIAAEQKPQPSPVTPDDELEKLREKRMGASDSDRSKVFQAIAKVERQYPRDYRFPYERAKLAAKGSKAGSRNEAFKALSVAAEKAISTGKANEMLTGLEADKTGDFQKLAQGRQEWSRLLVALKRKDTSLLAKAQFQ
jgi:hypothetical protein